MPNALEHLMISVALVGSCIGACGPQTSESPDPATTSSSADASTQPPTSTSEPNPQPPSSTASTTSVDTVDTEDTEDTATDTDGPTEPPACGPDETCVCGALGCACGPAGTCSEGACNPDTGTCTLEQDGMMRVPAGTFWMGCREGIDADALSDPCPPSQLPYRQVTITDYWIDRLEVTKGDYRLCIDAGECTPPPRWDGEWYQDGVFFPGSEDMPAASVTWTQAKTYCESIGKRLPTDAEWEKAARGTDGRKYPWGMAEPLCEHANFKPWDIAGMKPGEPCAYRAMYEMLTPVGMFCDRGASPYGLCDMAGNVLEWSADAYSYDGYGDLPTHDPFREPVPHKPVVRRGSSWGAWSLSQGGYSLRTSQRQGGGINDLNETLATGLRCARSG